MKTFNIGENCVIQTWKVEDVPTSQHNSDHQHPSDDCYLLATGILTHNLTIEMFYLLDDHVGLRLPIKYNC